jgi:hypothetical protein
LLFISLFSVTFYGHAWVLYFGGSVPATRSDPTARAIQAANHLSESRYTALPMMNALLAEEGRDKDTIIVTDKNGKEILEGTIVRVSRATKAFQVPSSARGEFNENKEFVPSVDGEASKYLVVPEGMCGVVTKVYVQANLSANFKVQVKFTPGEDCNKEGFDPPVVFQMHFSSKEVECVS